MLYYYCTITTTTTTTTTPATTTPTMTPQYRSLASLSTSTPPTETQMCSKRLSKCLIFN